MLKMKQTADILESRCSLYIQRRIPTKSLAVNEVMQKIAILNLVMSTIIKCYQCCCT